MGRHKYPMTYSATHREVRLLPAELPRKNGKNGKIDA
jgi:hypothetical protein